ncbi:MAG: class I adenylate-forming enzyme family protein [Ignavibacterium sp.]
MKDFFCKYSNRDDLVAVRSFSHVLSYKELFTSAKEFSSKLSLLKNSDNKYIPILSQNNAEFVITTLALWNIGLVPVPINIRWTEKEIESVIIRNGFESIIYEKIFFEKLKNIRIRKISFDEVLSFPNNIVTEISNDEAVVIFTSGSTGEPKGVVHTFNSLANSIINGVETLKQNISDRWLASLPFYHIGGFQIICRALSNGCEIIIPENLESESLKKSIEHFNPTHISLVSTQLQRLNEIKTGISNSLKVTLIGGGFSDDNLLFKADEGGWKPVRVYGSSETASFVTAASVDEIKNNPSTVGKPVKNVEIKISDEDEVLISSNSLFRCYLNNQEETKAKLVKGFYHSGDLGKIKNGYLFLEARRSDLIITGGENVNPYEVEQALLKINGVREACVFALEDEQWSQKVCAAVVTSKEISGNEIRNFLIKEISSFKIPKEIFFTDSLPKTSLGKIERQKVRSMFEEKK